MSSPARKQAESEFDNLLGDLVNELAMAPPSQSAVSLIPEQPSEAQIRVDSTQDMATAAAEAAAKANARSSDTIKIIGIVAGSLTALGIAAMMVLGPSSEPVAEAPDVAEAMAQAQLATAQAAGDKAKADLKLAIAAKKQSLEASVKADADALAAAKAEAEAEAAKAKPKPKPRKPRKPRKPKPKPPGDDFDSL